MKWLNENNIKWFWIFVFSLFLASIVYIVEKDFMPNEYNPVAPLNIADKTTFLTRTKINALKGDLAACIEVLESSEIKFESLPDQVTGESCGLHNVIHLQQSSVSYGGGITLKCPALVSLMIWERHALQPLAKEILQQPIKRVKHFGTYSCRNINSAKNGKRSQHAYANAIDIAGFVLKDDSEINVLKDWGQETTAGRFLIALHKSACAYFPTVLGPEYNKQHKNHFHFDHGPSRLCR